MIAGVVAGLAASIGTGLLLYGPLFDGAGGDNADLQAMCNQVDRLPTTIIGEDIRPDDPLLWQLQAVSGLAAAAHLNGADESFREYGSDVFSGMQRVDRDMVDEALAGLRTECDAR